MSTLVQALAAALARTAIDAPVTQPAAGDTPDQGGSWLLILVLSAASMALAVGRLRVHRLRAVAGPERLPPTHSVGPVVAAMGVGVLALFVTSFLYMGLTTFAHSGSGTATEVSGTTTQVSGGTAPTNTDLIGLSIVGPVATLLASLALLRVIQPGTVRAIGFRVGNLPRGVWLGLVAAAVAVPLTFLAAALTQLVYRWTGFEHPQEHDLLKAMKTTTPLVQVLGILAAVVVAPLAEEFIFRGLLQTALTEMFVRFGRSAPNAFPLAGPAGHGFEVVQPVPVTDSGTSPDEPGTVGPPPLPVTPHPFDRAVVLSADRSDLDGFSPESAARRRAPRAWVAIAVTSVLFGLVHPMWMFPIIFFLSLCLGYAYERTGNLWTSISLHALFNATSTAIYLAGASG